MSQQDRLELASNLLASQALTYAKAQLSVLRQTQPGELAASAYGALCLYYARPFKQSDGLPRLRESVVPADLIVDHRNLLEQRDKVFAHSDKNAKVLGSAVNSVYVDVTASLVAHAPLLMLPTPEGIALLTRLLDEVHSAVEQAILTSMSTSELTKSARKPGRYRLNTTGTGEILIPAD